jgi:hypothetical protein
MKKRYTYKLLVQSEEKSRNILETAIYGLVAVSVITSIWQFAEQPNALPLQQIGKTVEQPIIGQIPS